MIDHLVNFSAKYHVMWLPFGVIYVRFAMITKILAWRTTKFDSRPIMNTPD